jgi:hypothetical protein
MIYKVRLTYTVDVYVTCSTAQDPEDLAALNFDMDEHGLDDPTAEIVDEGPELKIPKYAPHVVADPSLSRISK